MRRIALIPLLLLALAAVGCGAGAESDDAVDTETTQQEAAPIAASQVVQQFLESAEEHSSRRPRGRTQPGSSSGSA